MSVLSRKNIPSLKQALLFICFPSNYALLESLECKLSSSSASSSSSSSSPPDSFCSSSSSSSSFAPPSANGLCVDCDKKATIFCQSCGDLCSECSSSLHTRRSAQSHVLCAIQNKPQLAPACSNHPTKPVELFCTQCKRLVCALCVLTGLHKGHAVEDIPQVSVCMLLNGTNI